MAANDFSTLSLDSSEDSNKQDNKLLEEEKENERKLSFEINDDDLVQISTLCKFLQIKCPWNIYINLF